MGLYISHDAWRGSYCAFHRWRRKLAEVAFGDLDSIRDAISAQHDPLEALLCHSDCDGQIAPQQLEGLARRLEGLLPSLRAMRYEGGHIGSWAKKTETFIAGCRCAHRLGEALEFC